MYWHCRTLTGTLTGTVGIIRRKPEGSKPSAVAVTCTPRANSSDWLERLPYKQEVGGSSPSSPIL